MHTIARGTITKTVDTGNLEAYDFTTVRHAAVALGGSLTKHAAAWYSDTTGSHHAAFVTDVPHTAEHHVSLATICDRAGRIVAELAITHRTYRAGPYYAASYQEDGVVRDVAIFRNLDYATEYAAEYRAKLDASINWHHDYAESEWFYAE